MTPAPRSASADAGLAVAAPSAASGSKELGSVDSAAPGNARRRVAWATLAGTTIEFYDFYLYATAAVAVFPALFFPSADATAAQLASLATFAAAFVARPLGSILFGHLGDRRGRKTSLILSLLLMGGATVLIGLLPPYAQVGLWAPVILTILRFCQGLGLSGEWTGATLLSSEHAARGRRGRGAMWPQLGAPLGFLLANGAFLLLMLFLGTEPGGAFHVWAWRVPFLASVVLVFLGWWLRSGVQDSPALASEVQTHGAAHRPVLEVLATQWRAVALGAGAMVAMYVVFYLMIAWSLSHALRPADLGGLGLGYAPAVTAQLLGVPLFAGAVILGGELSARWGAARTAGVVAALLAAWGLCFPALFPEHAGEPDVLAWGVPLSFQLFLWLGMSAMGLASSTVSALLPTLFPARLRFSGVGLASNSAALVGAAATPYIALWLDARWGVGAVGLYLSAAALLSLACIWRGGATRNNDDAQPSRPDVVK